MLNVEFQPTNDQCQITNGMSVPWRLAFKVRRSAFAAGAAALRR